MMNHVARMMAGKHVQMCCTLVMIICCVVFQGTGILIVHPNMEDL